MSAPSKTVSVPAVEGWFTGGEAPALVGLQCNDCSTLVFPPMGTTCPNPACRGDDLTSTSLSRTGKVWSYATNHYAPPPPYKPTTEPFEPVTVVAVELDGDGLVILGQLEGSPENIQVGTPMRLSAGTLFIDADDIERTVWTWAVEE